MNTSISFIIMFVLTKYSVKDKTTKIICAYENQFEALKEEKRLNDKSEFGAKYVYICHNLLMERG